MASTSCGSRNAQTRGAADRLLYDALVRLLPDLYSRQRLTKKKQTHHSRYRWILEAHTFYVSRGTEASMQIVLVEFSIMMHPEQEG